LPSDSSDFLFPSFTTQQYDFFYFLFILFYCDFLFPSFTMQQYDFFPVTFILPNDYNMFVEEFKRCPGTKKNKKSKKK